MHGTSLHFAFCFGRPLKWYVIPSKKYIKITKSLDYEIENYGSWVWVVRAIQVSFHFLEDFLFLFDFAHS